MKQKDLAEVYLAKAQENAIYFKNGNFPNMPLFQENDIKAAFNAGRKSVIGGIPDLEWDGNHDTQTARCVAGVYIITMSLLNGIELTHNLTKFDKRYGSFASAKQAANEHFKQTLKQALKI
ncbi:hypothetical protein [Prevotella intermedia]|uniref:Uncharacterized protein n=1 Tax=Prevotella intermedia TaxID=28131 RepID=A0A2G8I6P1_PREIN|nr:hypothetical protein [Prevotella intermedia]PIK19175.1 hypothetical protein CTI18_09400 [Prevotella intermedia]